MTYLLKILYFKPVSRFCLNLNANQTIKFNIIKEEQSIDHLYLLITLVDSLTTIIVSNFIQTNISFNRYHVKSQLF